MSQFEPATSTVEVTRAAGQHTHLFAISQDRVKELRNDSTPRPRSGPRASLPIVRSDVRDRMFDEVAAKEKIGTSEPVDVSPYGNAEVIQHGRCEIDDGPARQ